MYSEARKLPLIEEVLKIKSEATLLALEDFLHRTKAKNKPKPVEQSAFAEF